MKHVKHLLFVLIILIGASVVGVIAGGFLTPDDFGWRDGWNYRAESLAEQKQVEPSFAASDSCLSAGCHDEKAEQEKNRIELGTGHDAIGCQACHGAALEHVASTGKTPGPKPQKYDDCCWTCHRDMPGRAGKIPVIEDLESHVDDVGGDEETSCKECHKNPHDPEADF